MQTLADNRVPPQKDMAVIDTEVSISQNARKRNLAKVRKRKLANASLAQVQRKDRLVRLNNRIISQRNDGKVAADI